MSDTRLCNVELRRKPTRDGGLVCISRGCEIRLGYGLSDDWAEDQLKRLIERDLEVVLLMLVSDHHDFLEDELVEHSADVVGCPTVAVVPRSVV